LCLGLPNDVFPSVVATKTMYAFLISPMRATCPSQRLRTDPCVTQAVFPQEYCVSHHAPPMWLRLSSATPITTERLGTRDKSCLYEGPNVSCPRPVLPVWMFFVLPIGFLLIRQLDQILPIPRFTNVIRSMETVRKLKICKSKMKFPLISI
jgi:hypothetical protein